jgi:hypothetical protein
MSRSSTGFGAMHYGRELAGPLGLATRREGSHE